MVLLYLYNNDKRENEIDSGRSFRLCHNANGLQVKPPF